MKKLFTLFAFMSITIVSCDKISDLIEQNKDADSEYDYYYLDLEDYPEWNTGVITKDNTYLLIKEDTLSNGYIGYLNNSDITCSGLALYFDKDINLTSFSTELGSCSIYWKSNNKADLHIITESSEDFYEDIYIDSSQIIPTRIAWVPVIMAVARGVNIVMTTTSTVQGMKALLNGDFQTAGRKAFELLCGGVGGKFYKHALDDVAIDAAFSSFEKLENKLEQAGQAKFLGDCQIYMSAKKIGCKIYRLELTVSGYETIPVINSATGVEYEVSCGIAVRKWPHVTYAQNELIIKEFDIDGNGTKSVDFELPEATGYYAVPYIIPTQHVHFPEHYVRYGNTVHLEYFDGHIDEFKQLSCTENDGIYKFKCSAHAICNTKEEEYWKLYYENDTEWKVFYSAKTYNEPTISASNTGEFEFEIEIHSRHFKDGDKKDIKLGIARFDKNHNMIIASEPQIFQLTAEDDRWVDLGLPSGILWAKYDLGANSPDQQGDPYMWGYTESLIEDYAYYVYETVDLPQRPYNEEMGFYMTGFGRTVGTCLTPNNDISGTDYDAASVIWGDGARIPTRDECLELINNCSIREGKYKDTEGYYLKGMNNNEIFLSSFYWTSTMFVDIDPLYELKWDPENERYVIYNIDYLDYNCAYIFWPLKYESWPTIPVSESTSLKIEFWERSDALPIRPVKRNNTI